MELGPGRTAVVTGGGSGIGEALCRAFASTGMNVVVSDVDGDAAEGPTLLCSMDNSTTLVR